MKKLLLFFVFAGIITAFLLGFYAKKVIYTPIYVENEIIFQIKKGDSLNVIAETLWQNKLINHKLSFVLYAKLYKIYPKIKAGEYLVNHSVNLEELTKTLVEGKVYLRKITIPEGLTSDEVKQILLENEFLSGKIDDFADGIILPETYTFSKGDSRKSLLKQAKNSLDKVLEQAWNGRDENLPFNSPQEMLVLASIVEKETGVFSERAQVASVFVNRLRLGMRLQTDPTVIYAITLGKEELNRPLYRRDLEIDSPYNTYKYAGLPPSPICNAGKEAIFAVAHPDKTPYLYFVASGKGGHNFAKSLSEHNNNVNLWKKSQKNK